jgi:colanic acid biosynthesis glycosyl transferase WcaI
MRDRGHQVEVIAAHPHYPAGLWPQRVRPYRELRDGIRVTRLPLRIGHANARQRIVEELTYMASTAAAAPFTRTPDAVVTVSPAFLALLPMVANVAVRRVPWILWLQDIFPDAALTTGLLKNTLALRGARTLESLAYRAADRIVVISETFEENLLRKGVPARKLHRIYNPATRGFDLRAPRNRHGGPARILYMGNIGFSQGLVDVVGSFERDECPDDLYRLVIAGGGALENEVRREIRSNRVEWLGLVSSQRLEEELQVAALGLVTQRRGIAEFNVPSKLMTLMARGLPILAIVPPGSEVARIVERSGGGWIADSAQPNKAARLVAAIVGDRGELERRAGAARAFAEKHFSIEHVAAQFEAVLEDVVLQDSAIHAK